MRSMKELPTESPSVSSFRRTFELGRSFDLDDDLDFVPTLITESDVSFPTPDVEAGLAWLCPPFPVQASDLCERTR